MEPSLPSGKGSHPALRYQIVWHFCLEGGPVCEAEELKHSGMGLWDGRDRASAPPSPQWDPLKDQSQG